MSEQIREAETMEAIVNGDEDIEGGWEVTHTHSPTNATTAPDRLNTMQWVLGQMSTQDNAPTISWFDAEDLQIQQLKGMHPAYGLHQRNIASLRRFLHHPHNSTFKSCYKCCDRGK